MPSPEVDLSETDENFRIDFGRLEKAVRSLVEHSRGLDERAHDEERKVKDLQKLFQSFTEGGASPGDLLDKLSGLEAENRDLKERMELGQAAVERLRAKIRFLEDQQ